MTRNMFLGADLTPAINAASIPEAIDGAGTVWNELQTTKFSERVVPLAREIKASKADVVGLQEVALWRKQTPSDGGAPPISPLAGATPATAVEIDFLALLKAQLGSSYKVAVTQQEFDAELPVDVDHNDATGSGPLAAYGADFDARLTLRNVILVRKGSKVKLGKTRTGNYKTRYEPNVGGIKIPVDRGWTSVEAHIGTHKFRFVNTHLEAYGDPKIREAQAKELTKGPFKTHEQLLFVGDLNSGDKADGEPEKPGDELAFAALTKFGFKNNGARQSCCFANLFEPGQTFTHTVDHVLSKPGLKTVKATITGHALSERTPSGLWPSDHGGVVSTVRLR
jgi:endonuclease/exonuclease/phosphatase family metal-dependent hydrolase